MKRARAVAIALGLLVLMLALVASGCGKKKKSASKSGGNGSSKVLDPSKADNAKGNVTWCIGKDTTGAFAQVVSMHNSQSNGVTAKLVELPTSADAQREQQTQRLRAKSPECDVLGIDVIWTAEYASQGWVYDLSKAIAKRKGDFIQSTVDSGDYQGKNWAIPFNTNAGFLYYRKDKVPTAPTTWQQVYEEARAKGGLVYQSAQYEGLTVNFLELFYSAGGKVLSDDGKKAAINSQEAEKALELMRDGYKNGAVPKANLTYMEEESRRAFEAGKPAFMRNWPYAYGLGLKSPIKGKFAITTLPGFDNNKGSGVLGGYNLAINAYSKNPGAALEFANFITSDEPQKIMAAKASLPPTVSATYDDPAVKTAMPFAAELRTAVEQAQPRPVSPVYTQISEAIYKNVYAVLAGRSTPEKARAAMEKQINEALATF
ncbi:MAG: ABC transporter substrate-binding protein [Actinomycetota bacterium]|nr:ABC transporter substrate-binding protein [Actinomycetota bacterium]